MKLSAWELFKKVFKQNDEVIVISSFDEMGWGKLLYDDNFCILRDFKGGLIKFYWEEVRFIAHDGFPVRKLKGADGSIEIENTDNESVQKYIREYMILKEQKDRRRTFVYGDPFMIEDCLAQLVNPGNVYNENLDNWEHEEAIILNHKNGASGILWDVPTIYAIQ